MIAITTTSTCMPSDTLQAPQSPPANQRVDAAVQTPQHAVLSLDKVSIAYEQHMVVDQLSLNLEQGDIACIVGASGCGKTTLLRAIAGFVPVRSGRIYIGANCVAQPKQSLPPEQRGVGLVFQDYALFPHLRAVDNVAFGLRHLDRQERSRRSAELLELVGLGALGQRFPHELSGGQQQRVALARALAPQPALLLMDEPFSNLDVELRAKLGAEVRQILKAKGTSAIFVTHDQQEAFAIADQVGVMNSGRLEQWDRPYALYHQPATRYVADFIGEGVFVPAKVLDAHHIETELGALSVAVPPPCKPSDGAWPSGGRVDVLLRPDDIVHDDASAQTAQVIRKVFRGGDFIYTLRLPSGQDLLALVPSHHDHDIGEYIGIRLDADHVILFPATEPSPAANI